MEHTSDPYNILSKVKERSQGVLNKIKNVALFLKQKILMLREVNLPNPITVEAIQYSQCPDVPADLSEFYRNLVIGSKN